MYDGGEIVIDRLADFFSTNHWMWNSGEIITLDTISCAIHGGQSEESKPFGDTWKHQCLENKSTSWHVGRIIYFINHPEEIKDIELDNMCYGSHIYPTPIIVDGNHRFMAAMWLFELGKMDKVHCLYGGRQDLLDYLTGESDTAPLE